MKTIALIAIGLFLTGIAYGAELQFAKQKGAVLGVWTPITGTLTSTSYPGTAQCEWTQAYQFKDKVVWFGNNDSTGAAVVKIVVYPNADVVQSWILKVDGNTENTITAGNGLVANIPEAVEKIDVFIKKSTDDTDFVCMVSALKREQ